MSYDNLEQYLREISAYPLLTREDEVELARRIRKDDEEALNTLVNANLRFVVSVARKYQNQGVALSDLINEGNLGLMRAARKFDETKGIEFISYAVWWIRQAILRALAERSHAASTPLKRTGTLQRIGKRSSTPPREPGREPTVEGRADELDRAQDEIQRTLSLSRSYLSLDAPRMPGDDNCLPDYLPERFSPASDIEPHEQVLNHTIEEALATLREREARILRLYFGLDGQEPMTLEKIGSLLGLTHDRVRQVKEEAMSKLHLASRSPRPPCA